MADVRPHGADARSLAILPFSVKPALALAAALAAAPAARAAEAPCWFENGVVVVAAEVAGIAGDFILDTGQPATQLAETQAQGAGFEATALTGDIRLAGLTLAAQPVAVADIDVRTGLFPTPIAGVIGSDSLKGLVLDVSPVPCRIGLWRPGQSPRLKAVANLPITWVAGRPTIPATVSDGTGGQEVALVVSTGADAAVRLSEALAGAPGAARPQELYPYGVLRPKLAALAFAGHVWRDLPGGLLKAETGVDGAVGAPVFIGLKLRFDLAADRLLLAGAYEKGPGVNRGPDRKPVRRR